MSEKPEQESPTLQSLVAKSVHDMKTPLSCMQTTVEILRMTSADPERLNKAIGILENQVKELNGQLDRLSKQSREFQG